MSETIREHLNRSGGSLLHLLQEYSYNPDLSKELEALDPSELSSTDLYKIVLWKLNRFPKMEPDLLLRLRSESQVEPGRHRECETLVKDLLRTPGIALPMASTVLRFLKPSAFQIIDDRAYRVLLPGKPKYKPKPAKYLDKYVQESTEIYFHYLDALHEICGEGLPFEEADKILYQLDIQLGNRIGD